MTVVVAEEVGVPNTHEARRQDVEQKAPQEFLGGQRHDLLPIVIGVVLPAEADDPVDEVDEAGVGDRDAMGIASEVGEHPVGSAKRRLGIHHPGLGVECGQEVAPRDGYDEGRGAAREGQAVRPVRAVERLEVLRAEDLGEGPHRKEKAAARGEPARAVAAQRAARDHAVQMEMLREPKASHELADNQTRRRGLISVGRGD